MQKINPFAKKREELMTKLEAERKKKRAALIKKKGSKAGRKEKAGRTKTYNKLQDDLKASFKAAEDILE